MPPPQSERKIEQMKNLTKNHHHQCVVSMNCLVGSQTHFPL